MIPREILKKIRRIELHTNRPHGKVVCGYDSQSFLKALRMATRVIDGDHADLFRGDREKNTILEPRHDGFTDRRSFGGKMFRGSPDALEQIVKLRFKLPSQSHLSGFVPNDSLTIIVLRRRREPQA